MMISDYFTLPYRLAFRQPWISSHGERTQREGFLIELKDASGNRGVGEAAPLPEMGTETLKQCHKKLLESAETIYHLSAEALLKALEPYRSNYPAFCCGMESAAVALRAAQERQSPSQWFNSHCAPQVRVNQFISHIDHSLIDSASSPIIKLKLGLAPLEQELEQLRLLCSQLSPKQQLRLDANQAWSTSEAEYLLQQLQGLPIESIEEPTHSPTLESTARLQQQTEIPIALDESVRQIGIPQILEHATVRRIVLKPTLLGGPHYCQTVAQTLQQQGIEVVITSALESSIGILSAAHCAAAIDPQQLHTHGLATAHLFNEDLTLAPTIKNGILHLP